MDEKSLIFGVSDDLENLIMWLAKKKIDLDFENDYYLNISPPPIPESEGFFGDSVISGIFVDLNENLLNKILNWLKTVKMLEKLKLKLIIDGNLLDLNTRNLQILLKVLRECSNKNS